MFRCTDRVPVRRIHHDDAASRCRSFINVVCANTRANDRLELLVSLEGFRCYLDATSAVGSVVLSQRVAKFVAREPSFDIEFDSVGSFKFRLTLFSDVVQHDNAWHGGFQFF